MEYIISSLAGFIIRLIESTGYWGVFFLMTIESALIPMPSEVTMPFAGYLVSTGRMNLHVLSFVGASANLFGSVLAYWLGWWGQERLVRHFVRRYGRFLLLSEREYDHAEKWFRRHGDSIVFFSRVLPGVRTFISLPAGVAKMHFGFFCIFTFFGSLIWSYFLAWVGFVLGSNWSAIEIYYRRFEHIIFALIAALVIFVIIKKIRR
jgi:membrane protein DedA with SNARE-associated domain